MARKIWEVKALLFIGDFFIVFGEALILLAFVMFAWGRLVQKGKIPAWTVVSMAPMALLIFIATEEPWKSEGDRWVVGNEKVGKQEFVVMQKHYGLGDCETTFWFKDEPGMWREYGIDGDMTHWRTVGFRNVASNRVDITRFGLAFASFDPISRQMWLIPIGEPHYAGVEQVAAPY